MEETVNQGGGLITGMIAAVAVIGTVMLLLGDTDAGMLRMCITCILEAAC